MANIQNISRVLFVKRFKQFREFHLISPYMTRHLTRKFEVNLEQDNVSIVGIYSKTTTLKHGIYTKTVTLKQVDLPNFCLELSNLKESEKHILNFYKSDTTLDFIELKRQKDCFSLKLCDVYKFSEGEPIINLSPEKFDELIQTLENVTGQF